jgi:hypothetical protein
MLKALEAKILEMAAGSREVVDEGCFTVRTPDGPRKMVLLRGEPEHEHLDSGWVLAFAEDVDDDTGEVREGAETWKVNVSLVPAKDDGRAGWYGEYVRRPRSD